MTNDEICSRLPKKKNERDRKEHTELHKWIDSRILNRNNQQNEVICCDHSNDCIMIIAYRIQTMHITNYALFTTFKQDIIEYGG